MGLGGFVRQPKTNLLLQGVTIVLSIFGWIFSLICLLNRAWRINDQEGLVVEQVRRSAGLWYKCTNEFAVKRSCEDIQKFWAALPAPILVGRVLMILAIGLESLSIVGFYIGSGFTSFLSIKNSRVDPWRYRGSNIKKKAYYISGVFVFISAILIAITVIWYMTLIADDYFKYEMLQNNGQTFDGRRYVWGPGLYIGWAAFVSNVLATFSLCCSICGGEFEEEGLMDHVVNDIGDHVRYAGEDEYQTRQSYKARNPNPNYI